MDYTGLATTLIQVRKWLGHLSLRAGQEKRQSEKDYEDALSALYTALNETQIYIGSLRKKRRPEGVPIVGFIRNAKTEAKLSRLWTKAAVKIRSYDIDLADRCRTKSEYWANPDDWSDKDLEDARIKIGQVLDDARKLL